MSMNRVATQPAPVGVAKKRKNKSDAGEGKKKKKDVTLIPEDMAILNAPVDVLPPALPEPLASRIRVGTLVPGQLRGVLLRTLRSREMSGVNPHPSPGRDV